MVCRADDQLSSVSALADGMPICMARSPEYTILVVYLAWAWVSGRSQTEFNFSNPPFWIKFVQVGEGTVSVAVGVWVAVGGKVAA